MTGCCLAFGGDLVRLRRQDTVNEGKEVEGKRGRGEGEGEVGRGWEGVVRWILRG